MATVEERLTTIEQDVAYLKAQMEHVATKTDVAAIKTAMTEDVAVIKTAMAEDAAVIKTAMAEMKSELMTELTWRTFGMVVGMFVAVASAVAVVQVVLG